jgi:hypothetical protein
MTETLIGTATLTGKLFFSMDNVNLANDRD